MVSSFFLLNVFLMMSSYCLVETSGCGGCDPLGSFNAEYQTCGGNRYAGLPFATRSPISATYGICATSQPLASQVCLNVLKQGGNAIDAAIAANAALGLMEPTGCGLGGDLFAIVYDAKSRQLYGLNASGRSSSNFTYDQMAETLNSLGYNVIPSYGPLPISIPGAVDGWFELHERFGKMAMAEILEPAISYATNGYPVSQVIASGWAAGVTRYRDPAVMDQITSKGLYPNAFDGFQQVFMPNGAAPVTGQIFKNPALANTLRKIQAGGRDEFYRGSIAQAIADYVPTVGLKLTKADFANHRSEWVIPLNTTYRGYKVFELPPNGQGLGALQMLNILEEFDLASMGHNSPDYLHLMVEAKKLAYADRAMYYADPDFVEIPIERLLSKEYAAERRQLIDMERASLRVDAGNLKDGDTIYLTTSDSEGNMVSFIQSNYRGMGSGIVVPELGFAFQDRGEMFNMNASHANSYQAGKRPFHTIIPAFVTTEDGTPFLSFGVMGGDMQCQGHVQIISNIIDFGMNVQEAGDAARYHHTLDSEPTGYVMEDGGILYLERGICQETRNELIRRGHNVKSGDDYGGYQAILKDRIFDGVYHGASEMRKDGQAVGY